MKSNDNQKFTVIAESKNYDKPLYLHNLTFSRLIDDIVMPYQSKAPFFVDGVPINTEELKKIKIIQQKDDFNAYFDELHTYLRYPQSSGHRIPTGDYTTRLESLFREAGDDVTSQIIKAFDTKIKPSLKDYIPKRQELIDAAFKVFMEGMKYLGGSN